MNETTKATFVPKGILRSLVELLKANYPEVFSLERIQVVGVDIPAARILDNKGRSVEARNGKWSLEPGFYWIDFGFAFPNALQEECLLPWMFWRSSNYRLGAGGGNFFAMHEDEEESGSAPSSILFGGNVMGGYYVRNPYGVEIEKGAAVAQACFTLGPYFPGVVSELLMPSQVIEFVSKGTIGRYDTTLPETEEVPLVAGKTWQLQKNRPYLVWFKGRVSLRIDEVLTPTMHCGDWLENPKICMFDQHSCLGDPGYQGRIGMLIVPMSEGVGLCLDEGIARVAKQRVIPIGELAEYEGQWQEEGNDAAAQEIKFRTIHDWPRLTGVAMPSLEALIQPF